MARVRSTLAHRGQRGFALTLFFGAAWIFAAALAPRGSAVQTWIGRSGLGALIGILPIARPQGFWELPGVRALRALVGDRVAVALYVSIGLFWIAAASFNH